jgi:hypothetical protein
MSGRSGKRPCYRVVEHGVGHGLESPSVVDEKTIWVEHAITAGIWTFIPDYAKKMPASVLKSKVKD